MEAGRNISTLVSGNLTLKMLVFFWRFEESRQPTDTQQAANTGSSSLLMSDLALVDISDPGL